MGVGGVGAARLDGVDQLAGKARAARVTAGEVEPGGIVVGNQVVGVGDEIVTTHNARRLVTTTGAWVRNGDKGDIANVAVIARRPEYLPYIAAALTPDAVRDWYVHHLAEGRNGRVDRFSVPGISAFNFLLHGALDGGCTTSLRFDPLGKSVAQEVLDFPIPVSATLARLLKAA